ncbi:MAG: glycosyltransferase family 39 protein [Anaerolineae bacterium]
MRLRTLRWGLVGLLLAAWALRIPPLLDSPLHSDEALYGYWGLLIGSGRDPWLTSGPVYKPPLLPYVVSIFQLLIGKTMLALRLPGLIAGMLTVPLVATLAHTLYKDLWTGAIASAAVALSPFAIVYSGSAFPDPLMIAFGVGACVAAARGCVEYAALLAGLSFATKQTGLAWLPLVLGVALVRGLRSASKVRGFMAVYLTPVLVVMAWDIVRVALGANSFWSAGTAGYGGLRLIWSHELWTRLRAWTGQLRTLFKSLPVNVLLLVGVPALVGAGLVRRPRTPRGYFDLLLISFCLIYALLHWLFAFPVWGRYVMPLMAILAVLLGRIIRESTLFLTSTLRLGVRPAVGAGLLILLLVAPAYEASAGRYAAAEDRAVYRGIGDVVSFLRDLPEGSVVYHHWLGWHYRYALFDAPIYLAYWPTPAWLAQDVQAFGGRDPRYVAFPGWESTSRVETALLEAGYALEPVLSVAQDDGAPSFVVYHIVPSPA